MPVVAEALLTLLRKQVAAHCTLVWYDPDLTYLALASSLAPEQVAGAAVYRYEPERGFVWLRRQLEPLWAPRTTPPRLLIYVPLAQADAHNALIEFEVAGAVVQPDQQPPERNTALAAVARQALAPVFPPAKVEEVVHQVEAGQLTLSELDRLAEKGGDGVLAVLFGTGIAQEIALRFLADPSLDGEIEKRQALDNLAGLLGAALGISFSVKQGLAVLRAQVARQVLATDLIEAVSHPLPSALSTFPLAAEPVARQAAAELAGAWRMRRDLAASYLAWAATVQGEIGLSSLDLKLEALARTETFVAGESRLQALVEGALAHRPLQSLVDLADVRLGGFWSANDPEVKTRWDVITDAGRVLVEAARVANELKGKAWSADALLSRYARGDQPWCTLDAAQRHMERDFRRFELDAERHDSLNKLVTQARQRYAAASDHLAELFARAFADAHFELPGVPIQADTYKQVVAPALQTAPVAYLLVDALRFEMARELMSLLEPGWNSELVVALATPPTITEVGMAALLPGADKGLSLVETAGKLATVVAGQPLRTRQERMAYLQAAVGQDVLVCKLDQLAPLSENHLRQALKASRLIVVTATEEVDGLCETNPALARRMLDDVLNQLRRGLKTLFGLGVQTAVITADHGYLFGEALASGQAIDAPGGKTLALKRRVWIGQGGAKHSAVLRAPLSALGLGGDLEIATPWNLSCFKAKGGGAEYFHGGLSLPEIAIPVLTVRAGGALAPSQVAPLEWTLTLGSHTIATRFVSVTIEGRSTELLPVAPPSVRVDVRAGAQSISVPVSASYGFQEATRDVQLALEGGALPATISKNTVTLMISETPDVQEVTIHLLDAGTGMSLARLERVPFAIAI